MVNLSKSNFLNQNMAEVIYGKDSQECIQSVFHIVEAQLTYNISCYNYTLFKMLLTVLKL